MKKTAVKTIVMTEQEILDNLYINLETGTVDFYRYLFHSVTGKQFDTDCKSIDCRKITVSCDFIDAWRRSWQSAGGSLEELNLKILLYGPKSSSDLPNRTVCVEDGAITMLENQAVKAAS